MQATSTAVVFESPGHLALREVELPPCAPSDCVVDVEWTGISTGTERLLYDGRMPPFPGLEYPLVPGYESVGRVISAGTDSAVTPGTRVFVPGSRGFTNVRGLFGAAAERLVVPSERLVPLAEHNREEGVLLALAATAIHALDRLAPIGLPELIVGHGVLGRLIARLARFRGAEDLTVWETAPERMDGASGYRLLNPEDDARRDYQRICDVSGDATLLNALIGRLTAGGTILLSGFYHQPISFDFAPAFMREISLLIAAEWTPDNLKEATGLLGAGALQLDDLITHRFTALDAEPAYATAFSDPKCLKLVLDWRSL